MKNSLKIMAILSLSNLASSTDELVSLQCKKGYYVEYINSKVFRWSDNRTDSQLSCAMFQMKCRMDSTMAEKFGRAVTHFSRIPFCLDR